MQTSETAAADADAKVQVSVQMAPAAEPYCAVGPEEESRRKDHGRGVSGRCQKRANGYSRVAQVLALMMVGVVQNETLDGPLLAWATPLGATEYCCPEERKPATVWPQELAIVASNARTCR